MLLTQETKSEGDKDDKDLQWYTVISTQLCAVLSDFCWGAPLKVEITEKCTKLSENDSKLS